MRLDGVNCNTIAVKFFFMLLNSAYYYYSRAMHSKARNSFVKLLLPLKKNEKSEREKSFLQLQFKRKHSKNIIPCVPSYVFTYISMCDVNYGCNLLQTRRNNNEKFNHFVNRYSLLFSFVLFNFRQLAQKKVVFFFSWNKQSTE